MEVQLRERNEDKEVPKVVPPLENVRITNFGCPTVARCLKIKEKVSFNIASEASYVYILSAKGK